MSSGLPRAGHHAGMGNDYNSAEPRQSIESNVAAQNVCARQKRLFSDLSTTQPAGKVCWFMEHVWHSCKKIAIEPYNVAFTLKSIFERYFEFMPAAPWYAA